MEQTTPKPCNIQAEQALLGILLRSNEQLGRIAGTIEPEHFSEPLHADVFEAIRRLVRAGKQADPITLKPFVLGVEPINGVPVESYLVRLVSHTNGMVSAVRDYAELIAEQYHRRQLLLTADDLVRAVQNTDAKATELAAVAIGDLDGIVCDSRPRGRTLVEVGEVATKIAKALGSNSNERIHIPTGLEDLDAKTGGWRPGTLTVIAGRPSMGKTAVALSLARQTAIKGQVGVMVFGLEMTNEEMAARMLVDHAFRGEATCSYSQILQDRVPTQFHETLRNASEELESLYIKTDEKRAATVAEISAKARQQKARWENDGIRMGPIFVDHIGLVRPTRGAGDNRVRQLAEITDDLATLAKELNVPMVALSQLNREVDKREKKRPILPDLRESGSIEENADTVMFAYRPAYYLERMIEDEPDKQEEIDLLLRNCRNDFELIIAKNRSGETSTVHCFVAIHANAFRNKAFRNE